MTDALRVRFRIDFGAQCSVGIGKIELLEAIDRTGSLSQAARAIGMSYRRAWLLMADLNSSFDAPVVDTATGGAHGGGAVLTPFGARLVQRYRQLESSLQPLANRCLSDVRKRTVTAGAERRIRVRPSKRRAVKRAPGG
ncbi:MAG: LysR family transcriptional regulator [Steroidobacteraceae bacterium]|jgi:molybdate transport system regulatory protein